MNDIVEGYAAAATPSLIARYDAFDPSELYAPVRDLIPDAPMRVADIGAGTGRDAAWFARQGHDVVAVEPVEAFRSAGMELHRGEPIEWLDDQLPDLAKLRHFAPFGLVTMNGVWQHIDDEARSIAAASIGRMVSVGGRLVMSLRHGPGAPGRRVFQIDPDDTVEATARSGFGLLRRTQANSIQPGNRAMGVWWTWLAFEEL